MSVNGLISPTTTIDSPEPNQIISADPTPAQNLPEDAITTQDGQRIVRKRKRNCLSCLRCHRLKVKCDKELPCGRCKSSGNGRECYYSYNKGPNGGKFPCPTAPAGGPIDPENKKPQLASWQITHKVRGSSHWRELMARVRRRDTTSYNCMEDSTDISNALDRLSDANGAIPPCQNS
jgi:hypothetical protein